MGLAGIATGLPQRAPLPQQVPALVKLGLDRAQAPVLLRGVDLAVLEPLAQLLLLGNQLFDPLKGVFVGCHVPSLPD